MLVEHPEICSGCCRWQDVENRRFVDHAWPGEPKNAAQRRSWKKRGKPLCPGSGKLTGYPGPTVWIER